jgi:hypothetical protein
LQKAYARHTNRHDRRFYRAGDFLPAYQSYLHKGVSDIRPEAAMKSNLL